jgi:tetratricopeptide (TPR) repeat protein
MLEKIIKKIINATMISEQWRKLPKSGESGHYFRCEGEVKNTGLSEIKELIVLGAVYKKDEKKLLTFIDKEFKIHKSAGYFVVFNLKPEESVKFSVLVNLPAPSELLWGRSKVKKIDDEIRSGKLKQKAFLVFDTKQLDEKTKKWFKSEGMRRVKIITKKWEVNRLKYENIVRFRCYGSLRNTGTIDGENVIIAVSINDFKMGVPLKWKFKRKKIEEEFYNDIEPENEKEEEIIEAKGNIKIPFIKVNQVMNFDISFNLPELSIIEKSEWDFPKIMDGLEKGELEYAIDVGFEEENLGVVVYRDVFEDPNIIQTVKGERKIDILKEIWGLESDDSNQRYRCDGILKNTGNVNLEDVYIISSILDPKKNEPIMWQSGSESFKTLEIQKIPYLKIGEEKEFYIYVSLPKSTAKTDLNAETIIGRVNSGSLLKRIDLYYKKEDVKEEGIKRLNLGNSYFRLGNFSACIKEYNEGIKLIPQEKRFYFNVGLTYYKMLKLYDSREVLEKALGIDPLYAKALYLVGLVHIKLKEWDVAIERFKRAITNDPNNEKIFYNISCCYFGRGEKEIGYKWLERAIQLNRQFVVSKALQDPELTRFRRDSRFIDIIKESESKQ